MAHVWTKSAKASGTSWTKLPKPSDEVTVGEGNEIGLLIALTTAGSSTKITGWTKQAKASGTIWTKIIKAT